MIATRTTGRQGLWMWTAVADPIATIAPAPEAAVAASEAA